MKHSPVFRLVLAGTIAALYAALTWAIAPQAFLGTQFRISEAMTVLAALTPTAIPGLTIGCLLANFLSPFGVIDMIIGTAASLIAAVLSYLLRGIKLRGVSVLSPLPPVLVNALMIGWMLTYFAPEGFQWGVFLTTALSVGFGQLISCYGLGLPLLAVLQRKNWKGFPLSE